MATETEPQLSFEQPRPAFGTWVGVVLLFVVFALFVWVVMGALPRGDAYEQKRAKVRAEKFKAASDEAATALHTYGWVDKTKGVARIPIQRAMELSVAELSQKQPAAAYPIATPASQPGAQTTAPETPAAAPTAPPTQPSPSPATAISGPDSENRNQPAAANNPPPAPPGTQPGPSATAAASPPAPASHAQPNPSAPSATPVQSPPGTPLPIPGKTP